MQIEEQVLEVAHKYVTVDVKDDEKEPEPRFSNTQKVVGSLLLVGGAVAVYKFYKRWQKKWKELEEREDQHQEERGDQEPTEEAG